VIPAKGSAQIILMPLKHRQGLCIRSRFAAMIIYANGKFLQESGLQLVCCTEKTNDYIYTPDYTMPTAIIMGSEDEGIRNE
jgi:23S rRNA (guanosine2251-2'-O)-methyltransferase